MKTLFLVDGHAHFFRAYHAIRTAMNSPVTNEPTNMTFGFTGMILKLIRDYDPHYLAVVIDAAGDRETFRSELYPEYKANREAPPDDFRPQVTRCLEVLKEFSIPVIAHPGVEADDVIASLVRELERDHPDVAVRIVSRDKDLTQLVDGTTQLLDVYKDETVAPETIFKTEGVKPEHVVDILALMGDSVDNVPGVAGIGPKTAAKLILQYGSIDNLLTHLDELKGKRRENLEAAREMLPLSRQLVQLKDDLDVDFELESAHFDASSLDVPRLVALFRELGFNRHAQDVVAMTATAAPTPSPPPAPHGDGEATLFDMPGETGPATPRRPEGDYTAVTDAAGLAGLVGTLEAASSFAMDTETDSVVEMQANLCGIAFAVTAGAGWYVPVRSPDPSRHLDLNTVLDALRPLLESASHEKVGHNLKFDIKVLRRHGVTVAGPLFDTMIASYVIDATRSSHRLDALALALLGYVALPLTDLIGRGREQRTFDAVPLDDAVPYAAEDADIAWRLRGHFAPLLDETGLDDLFDRVEIPLVEVLADMEYNGIRVNPDELDRQRAAIAGRIESLRSSILEAAPHPFNPDSPKQLAAALFNKAEDDPPGLGIRPLKRGKTGPSTDQEVLDKLAADLTIDSPVPTLIVEYRQLTKLVNTYLVALKDAINPETGRVHASFNQTVAATGRLSASEPNLQNIPIRTDIGREIRRAFVADPGARLVTADYSQIELRLLAHLAEDPALIAAFHDGEDIHTAVASEVFGVRPSEVTVRERSSAKMINFGIVYGITPFGLARRLGPDVSVTEAKTIIDDYKSRFTKIDAFLEACIANAERDGYVETILGRRRAIPQIHARHPARRSLGERMAINTVVQGSAADLIKLAMIEVWRALRADHPQAKLVLQIHDELVIECPAGEADVVAGLLQTKMEGVMELAVPLVAETSVSESWYDAK